MAVVVVPGWKRAPFLRILLALSAGILLQWYLRPPGSGLWVLFLISFCAGIGGSFMPLPFRYRYAGATGMALTILFMSAGALLTRYRDLRNDPHSLYRNYTASPALVALLEEAPAEKARSLKALARVTHIRDSGAWLPVNGKILIYFRKDSLRPPPQPGTEIIFAKSLQRIRHSGNPGAFNYPRYCLFQGITHQVFLEPGDYAQGRGERLSAFRIFINDSRERILNIIRKYIPGEKERGLAEALLIGYKNDLDKSLSQTYANTGVIHVIAISGLHLGLVYWLLAAALKPLLITRALRWIRMLLIIAGLWTFSILAGAQPSVLRSALMFSCLALGEQLSRKSSTLNSLAASAFILLCLDPFFLWDPGFQLSYTAVLGIVLYTRPISNWYSGRYKLPGMLWKMNAVTLSAQLLTTPISIYLFQQFPNFFLPANLVAVPASSFILLGEILLCLLSGWQAASTILGEILYHLIRLMNEFVKMLDSLPHSRLQELQLSAVQVILLYAGTASCSWWLMHKKIPGLKGALAAWLLFLLLRATSLYQAEKHQKLIVYNVPGFTAVDLLIGRTCYYYGDSSLLADRDLSRFHLDPSRRFHRTIEIKTGKDQGRHKHRKPVIQVGIAELTTVQVRDSIDLLLVSGQIPPGGSRVLYKARVGQVVFTTALPWRRSTEWKELCDSLGIPWYDISIQGAFVMNLR